MKKEQSELNSEENDFKKMQEGLKEKIDIAKNEVDEFINLSEEIIKSRDINPFEDFDEFEDEAKEVYSQILLGIENPLKIPHKQYSREVNLLLTDKFLTKILISEEDFIKVYKEAFGN